MTTTDQFADLLELVDRVAPRPWYVEEIRYNENGGIITFDAAPGAPVEPDAASTTWAIYGTTGYQVADLHINHGPTDEATPTEIAGVRATAHLIVAAVNRVAAQLGEGDGYQGQPPVAEEGQGHDVTAYLSPARAAAWLAFTDVGWSHAEHEDVTAWGEELRWEHGRIRDRVIEVGTSELDAVRRAIASGRHVPDGDCQGDADALANVKHGCMSSWRRTPYGVVWLDC
ncbi:hypothetical protein ACWGJ2_40485 [Streptomyces sp. NPDC054796]